MRYGIPREDYIAGVRALCDWLEDNPDAGLPSSEQLLMPLTTNARVEAWAEANGMTGAIRYNDEGNASVDVQFGPVTLHVYGYRDFAEHCDRNDGRTAERYAERHNLALVAAEAAVTS